MNKKLLLPVLLAFLLPGAIHCSHIQSFPLSAALTGKLPRCSSNPPFIRMTAMCCTSRLIMGGGGAGIVMITSSDVLPRTSNKSLPVTSSNKCLAVYRADRTIQSSDARLISNITGLSYGLSSVLILRPVSFSWKDDKSHVC